MKQHAVMGGPQPAVLQEVSCGPACGPAGQFKLAWFAGPGSGGLSVKRTHAPRNKNRAAAHATRDRARTPGGELQSICSETALPAPSSAVFSRRADTAGHRAYSAVHGGKAFPPNHWYNQVFPWSSFLIF